MYFYEHKNGKIFTRSDFAIDKAGSPEKYFMSLCNVKRWWYEKGGPDAETRKKALFDISVLGPGYDNKR